MSKSQSMTPTPTPTPSRKRAESNPPAISIREVSCVFVIWQEHAHQVGQMSSFDYRQFVQDSCATPQEFVQLTKNIGYYDKYARWFTLIELVKLKRITIYHNRQEAELVLIKKTRKAG